MGVEHHYLAESSEYLRFFLDKAPAIKYNPTCDVYASFV
jgi:hypothetical protein